MITFKDQGGLVVLVYSSDQSEPSWVDEKLNAGEEVRLARVFTVTKDDLLRNGDEDGEYIRRFAIGSVDGYYRTIRAEVLGLKHDLLVSVSVRLERKTFVAERDISIFRRIDNLVDEPIIVGGSREGAIPAEEFARLLREFPTSKEVTNYAGARVARILREYLGTMSDGEAKLARYMVRRERPQAKERAVSGGRIAVANELELKKFIYVRDRLVEMLADAEAYSEACWQDAVADLFLLVFPQYVAVLRNVHVKEHYSKESKTTDRYIDFALVAANGCIDIIEIKKPFQCSLLSKTLYRDNHVPVRELSGSIMQAEKYLFYLSKSGTDGEKRIKQKHAKDLPDALSIRIANPKAIILLGRDINLSKQESFDFEFVRRKYSNVMDIITYDDLRRRLENVINTLQKRVRADDDESSG